MVIESTVNCEDIIQRCYKSYSNNSFGLQILKSLKITGRSNSSIVTVPIGVRKVLQLQDIYTYRCSNGCKYWYPNGSNYMYIHVHAQQVFKRFCMSDSVSYCRCSNGFGQVFEWCWLGVGFQMVVVRHSNSCSQLLKWLYCSQPFKQFAKNSEQFIQPFEQHLTVLVFPYSSLKL